MIESSVSWIYECDVDNMEECIMDDMGRVYIWVLTSKDFGLIKMKVENIYFEATRSRF